MSTSEYSLPNIDPEEIEEEEEEEGESQLDEDITTLSLIPSEIVAYEILPFFTLQEITTIFTLVSQTFHSLSLSCLRIKKCDPIIPIHRCNKKMTGYERMDTYIKGVTQPSLHPSRIYCAFDKPLTKICKTPPENLELKSKAITVYEYEVKDMKVVLKNTYPARDPSHSCHAQVDNNEAEIEERDEPQERTTRMTYFITVEKCDHGIMSFSEEMNMELFSRGGPLSEVSHWKKNYYYVKDFCDYPNENLLLSLLKMNVFPYFDNKVIPQEFQMEKFLDFLRIKQFDRCYEWTVAQLLKNPSITQFFRRQLLLHCFSFKEYEHEIPFTYLNVLSPSSLRSILESFESHFETPPNESKFVESEAHFLFDVVTLCSLFSFMVSNGSEKTIYRDDRYGDFIRPEETRRILNDFILHLLFTYYDAGFSNQKNLILNCFSDLIKHGRTQRMSPHRYYDYYDGEKNRMAHYLNSCKIPGPLLSLIFSTALFNPTKFIALFSRLLDLDTIFLCEQILKLGVQFHRFSERYPTAFDFFDKYLLSKGIWEPPKNDEYPLFFGICNNVLYGVEDDYDWFEGYNYSYGYTLGNRVYSGHSLDYHRTGILPHYIFEFEKRLSRRSPDKVIFYYDFVVQKIKKYGEEKCCWMAELENIIIYRQYRLSEKKKFIDPFFYGSDLENYNNNNENTKIGKNEEVYLNFVGFRTLLLECILVGDEKVYNFGDRLFKNMFEYYFFEKDDNEKQLSLIMNDVEAFVRALYLDVRVLFDTKREKSLRNRLIFNVVKKFHLRHYTDELLNRVDYYCTKMYRKLIQLLLKNYFKEDDERFLKIRNRFAKMNKILDDFDEYSAQEVVERRKRIEKEEKKFFEDEYDDSGYGPDFLRRRRNEQNFFEVKKSKFSNLVQKVFDDLENMKQRRVTNKIEEESEEVEEESKEEMEEEKKKKRKRKKGNNINMEEEILFSPVSPYLDRIGDPFIEKNIDGLKKKKIRVPRSKKKNDKTKNEKEKKLIEKRDRKKKKIKKKNLRK